MSITGSTNFKGIEMEVIWQLLEGCLVPIITYVAEAMKYNKSEMKMMNNILDATIKRILMWPITTLNDHKGYTILGDRSHGQNHNELTDVCPKNGQQDTRESSKLEKKHQLKKYSGKRPEQDGS